MSRPEAVDRPFAEIAVGDEASFEVAIEERDVDAFAALSGDFNPRHMEAHAPFPARIVHGAYLTALFSRLVGMLLPGRRCVYLSQQTDFARPAFPGDRVTVRGQVTRKDEPYLRLEIKTTVLRGEVVLASGKAQVMVLDIPTEVEMTLQGKRAIVTGASGGIGRATAELLGRAGARVVLGYRSNRDGAEAAALAIRDGGGEATTAAFDLADRASMRGLFEASDAALGGLDVLVNCASPPLARKPAAEIEWAQLARELDEVAGGTLAAIQLALPRLTAAKGGAIVNVLTSALLGVPPPGLGSYIAAKSALAGLTKSLAVELGPKGIRVNAVSPGLTETAMTADIPQLMKNRLGSALPLGRTAQPDDVAAAIVFLCSDAARYLTGANLPVTGGGWML
jgi:NAD(P)-dependent dehydrogenase (short-subunit alcohol dehydrogenase family)/acyl dehydratase